MVRTIFFTAFILLLYSCQPQSVVDKVHQSKLIDNYIDDSLANTLNPILDDWVNYYDIKVSEFILLDTVSFDLNALKQNTFTYLKKFTANDNLYLPEIRDYSPDRTSFIGLIEASQVYEDDSRKWHFESSEINQEVFLCNRQDSSLVLISLKGVNYIIDASFWVDNQNFILVGVNKLEDNPMYFIELYDLNNQVMDRYCLLDSTLVDSKKWYMRDINLKLRDIILDK